jgi:hypothetical protein
MAKLTKQQADPHPGLVGCRNAIEKHITKDRKKAAHICNHLTDKQVDMVLQGGEDKAKIEEALRYAEVPPSPAEEVKEEQEKKSKRGK